MRGWPALVLRKVGNTIFQFTASCEADQGRDEDVWLYRNFSIHSLMRGWPPSRERNVLCMKFFNSQPHARLTSETVGEFLVEFLFNSQPHARLTEPHFYSHRRFGFSIHSLMRGWPEEVARSVCDDFFQFTASCEADRVLYVGEQMVRIFQFTASCEADLLPELRLGDELVFSIHSLMRGWPILKLVLNKSQFFSIHSLMRGWPLSGKQKPLYFDFSIHSLMRGWPLRKYFFRSMLQIFNSQPHARLTGNAVILKIIIHFFNSQPHARLTIGWTFFRKPIWFSIHSLMRGWPSEKHSLTRYIVFQFTASCEADQD